MKKKPADFLRRWINGKTQLGKFLAYFIIVNLLVAGFIGTLLYTRSASVLEAETVESNRNTLIQMNRSVDLILGQVDKFLTHLVMDPYVNSFMDYYSRNDVSTQLKITESLNNVLVTNNYIHSISIYYYNENKIFLLNKGVVAPEYYQDKEILDWVQKNRGSFEWIPSRTIYDEKSDKMINVITVIKPVQQVRYSPSAVAVVNIDEKYLSSVMNSVVTSKELELVVLDKKNNVVSRNYKRNLDITRESGSPAEAYSRNSGYYFQKLNGEKMLVSFITSDINGWKYISVIPYRVIVQKIAFIKDYAIIISLAGILLGVIVSFFFSSKIYKPIHALAGMFRSSESTQIENDTFKYISNNINRLKEKSESIEKVLNDHMPALRNNFLDSLLKGYITDPEEVVQKFAYYHVDLEAQGSFCVYVLSIDNFKSDSMGYTEHQINMLIVYMIQLLNEYIQQHYKGVAVNINENDVAMIVSFPYCEDEETFKNQREKLGQEIQKTVLASIKYSTSIGVGSIYREAIEISKSFTEAMEALQYRFVLGKNRMILFEEVMMMRGETYVYPFELEDQLIRSLKQGDLESVTKIHENIFVEMVKNKVGNHDNTYYDFMQLLSSVIKGAFDIGIDIESTFSGKNLYEDLLRCKGKSAIDGWFQYVYTDICRQIERRKNSKNHGVIDAVVKYINDNYSSDLSLYTLSQQVYLSVPYLSKIFRDEKGITLKQYINEVRMEKAKALLQNPKYKVNEVGEKVGYDKVHGFLKQFKEYTGMTPGDYRATLCIDATGHQEN